MATGEEEHHAANIMSNTEKIFQNRRNSILKKVGKEGQGVQKLQHKGENIAVFTSGGDSQGL